MTAQTYSWTLPLMDLAEVDAMVADARAFASCHAGSIRTASPELLLQLLEEVELLRQRSYELLTCPSLAVCRDTLSQEERGRSAVAACAGAEISAALGFFDRELGERLRGEPCLIERFSCYSSYLASMSAQAAHRLSDDAEQLLDSLRSGSRELMMLCADKLLEYRFAGPDSPGCSSPLRSLLSQKCSGVPRVARKSAAVLARRITADAPLFEAAFNSRAADCGREAQLRGFASSLDMSLTAAGIPADAYEAAVTASAGLAHDFYRTRPARGRRTNMLDLPSSGALRRFFRLETARDIVLGAFQDFDGLLCGVSERLFDGHVDAIPTTGKQSGAFCRAVSPAVAPYVLLNHQGTLADLLAMAHEIGHAAHFVLSSGKSFFNYFPSTPVAELFALFCEKIVLARLVELLSADEQQQLQSVIVERALARSVAQVEVCQFEKDMHTAALNGRAGYTAICARWQLGRQRFYGDSVLVPASEGVSWTFSGLLLAEPYYGAAYAVAEPVAELMYSRWQCSGQQFSKLCLEVFSHGGEPSFAEVLRRLELGSPADAVAAGYRSIGEQSRRRR